MKNKKQLVNPIKWETLSPIGFRFNRLARLNNPVNQYSFLLIKLKSLPILQQHNMLQSN